MTARFLYVEADTALHRLHPNTKLVCLLLLFAAVLAFNHPAYEGALVALSIVLLAAARSLRNLARAWRLLVIMLVVSALLWALFVRDIESPRIIWHTSPVLIERGTTPYDLAMLIVIAGLLMLAIVVLSLLQLVARELAKGRGSAGWWVALGVCVGVGALMTVRGPGLVPALWAWYLLVVIYLLGLSAVVLARARTPMALALWLALLGSGAALHAGLRGFVVHVYLPDTHYTWGLSMSLSEQAVLYGLAMGLRITAFLTFGLLFVSTTRPEEVTQGLRAAGAPLAVSVGLGLAFRLVPAFLETAHIVMQAQRARGLDLDAGGPITRLRHAIPVIVPTLAYALRSADDLTRALESRGLGATQHRTEYHELKATAVDTLAVVFALVFAAACIIARVSGNTGELLPRL